MFRKFFFDSVLDRFNIGPRFNNSMWLTSIDFMRSSPPVEIITVYPVIIGYTLYRSWTYIFGFGDQRHTIRPKVH